MSGQPNPQNAISHGRLVRALIYAALILFAIYYMLPRVLRWEWPFPRLISWHFWLAAIGILIYFGPLTYGGWLQGKAMLDPSVPFIDSVTLTIPYLYWRSVGGSLMLASHLIFAFHVLVMVLRFGPNRTGAALFTHEQTKLETVHGK